MANDTKIINISLKQLLSHKETTQQLTVYLSEHAIFKFDQVGINYVVSYDSISKTNQQGLSAELLYH